MKRKIGGVDYYYYVVRVEKGGQKQLVVTEIGARGADLNEFNERRWVALEEHGKKLKKMWLESQKEYHFDNEPEIHSIDDLISIKHGYKTFREELTREEVKDFEEVLLYGMCMEQLH